MSDIFENGNGILWFGGALLFLGFNYNLFQTSADIRRTVAGVRVVDPLERQGLKIVDNRENDERRFKPGYLKLARFNDIGVRRRIKFSTTVEMRNLLRPGDTLPKPGLEGVFLNTRAIFFAHRECKVLEEILAARCDVDQASAVMRKGLVRINASLRFIQKTDFGKLDPDATWSFQSFRLKLNRDYQATSLSEAPQARKEIYRKMVQQCAELKRSEGNCAITGGYIASERRGKSFRLSVYGSVDLSYLARR